MPLDEVKTDISLLRAMIANPGDRAIVHATIELAHAYGLEVTAEGVEDEAALRLVPHLRCNRAQGYAIARPTPPSQLGRWLETQLSGSRILLRAGA